MPNHDSPYFQETFDFLDYPPHHMTQWSKQALLNLANIMGYTLIEYCEEKIRIEHYDYLIKSRRLKITVQNGNGLLRKLKRKIIDIATMTSDKILLPYMLDDTKILGHTHGVLLQKN